MSSGVSSTSDFIMTEEPVLQKRPYGGNKYGEPPAKRAMPTIRVASGFQWNLQALSIAADAVESGGKSPVSALNELGVKVAYKVLRQAGPAHCPSFHIQVHVADMTFEGWGHSKRDARASAARACLSALLARAGRVLPSSEPHADFTSDVIQTDAKMNYPEYRPKPQMKPDTEVIELSSSPEPPQPDISPSAALFGSLSPASNLSKSPINLLYENYPGLNFTCTFGDGSPLNGPQAPLQLSHSMRFKVICQIKDQVYEGYGSSKKLAKLAAARAALAVLDCHRAELCAPALPSGALPQALADHIAKVVNEKFNELMRHDLVHSKRKVLAGIVITEGDRIQGSKIIAVTTGTKCVSGEHMSVRGRAVNDCHAEVAARRCLQRYLYAQLLQYAQQKDPTKPIPSSDIEPVPGGGYQLKASKHVHLYVSTAPCGDGRIFSPHEHREAPDPHPNRQARGQLRTKIESGEGTIPVKNSNYIQTWDGVMQGERLLTMSCSDKVARWCVVGLQGALLSRVLRPVYLHSLVLGSLLHTHHMYRALCGRIEAQLGALPPPYRLRRPLLARAASTEARTPARAPSFSVCWSETAPQPEILNAMTGKLESGQPSLLCKQTMFARWQHLLPKLPPLQQSFEMDALPPLPDNPATLLYSEAKLLCPGYQEAKRILFAAFESAKLGKWIKKPLEQDEFCCEITDADPKHLFAWAGSDLLCDAVQGGSTGADRLEYGREWDRSGGDGNNRVGDETDGNNSDKRDSGDRNDMVDDESGRFCNDTRLRYGGKYTSGDGSDKFGDENGRFGDDARIHYLSGVVNDGNVNRNYRNNDRNNTFGSESGAFDDASTIKQYNNLNVTNNTECDHSKNNEYLVLKPKNALKISDSKVMSRKLEFLKSLNPNVRQIKLNEIRENDEEIFATKNIYSESTVELITNNFRKMSLDDKENVNEQSYTKYEQNKHIGKVDTKHRIHNTNTTDLNANNEKENKTNADITMNININENAGANLKSEKLKCILQISLYLNNVKNPEYEGKQIHYTNFTDKRKCRAKSGLNDKTRII